MISFTLEYIVLFLKSNQSV